MATSKPRTTFSVSDLVKGLTPDFVLGLIDDVKWRDSASKAAQYTLKLTGAVMQDNELLDASTRKETVANLNTAAGLISTARRVFRFLRWTRFAYELPANTADKDPSMAALKAVHCLSNLASCLIEDATTLERLRLLDPKFAALSSLGNLAWLSESATGLLITLIVVKKQSQAYKAALATWRSALSGGRLEEARGFGAIAFAQWVKYHFALVTLFKWVGECVAASHDNGYHGYTKAALAGSLLSSVISTYAQSAKLWK